MALSKMAKLIVTVVKAQGIEWNFDAAAIVGKWRLFLSAQSARVTELTIPVARSVMVRRNLMWLSKT
jgi:hypothetical protein